MVRLVEECFFYVPSDGVDWDSGGESGRQARTGRHTKKMARARRPNHLHCPDPARLTVVEIILTSKEASVDHTS